LIESKLALAQFQIYSDLVTVQLLNPQYLNTSYIDFDHKFNAQAGVKQYTGTSSEIQTIMASAGVHFKTQRNHQAIRANLWAMNEGPYIANQRFALNYALAIELKPKRYLSLGMDMGVFSRAYSAPTASTQGNAFIPDAAFSISYQSEKYSIGTSLNQLFNSKAQPLTTSFKLARYPSLFGNYAFDLDPKQSIVLSAYARYITETGLQEIVLATYRWDKKLEFGVGHKYQKEISLVGSSRFNVSDKELKLDLCFNIPHSSSRNTIGESVEVILSASF
jgi:hypothetical protein